MLAPLCFSNDYSTIVYHEYISPDKRYVAQVSIRETDSILIVKNQKSGEIESSMTILLTPILDIQWAPNSQSFVMIQHLAKSSLASLVHHMNSDWIKYDCEPPLKVESNYSVLDIKFLKQVVRIIYGLALIKDNGHIISFCLIPIDVNYQNGTILLKKIMPLSPEAFTKLKDKEEKNWIK